MNILLTTTQDHLAPGFAAMRAGLIAAGARVLSVTPSGDIGEFSGSDGAIQRIGGDDANPIYRHDALPVDCVQAVIEAGLAQHVCAVVCGVQDEGSKGAAVAAVSAAARNGLPSLCVSRRSSKADPERDFRWSAEVACEWAYWMIASPPPRVSAVEIRVPDCLKHRLIKRAVPGDTLDDRGSPSEGATPCADMILASGHVSVAPLFLGGDAPQIRERLDQWLDASLHALNPRLGAGETACVGGCCG
jgi:broad specificity polyphosphatase/5'/3'-nucleotidase SurE